MKNEFDPYRRLASAIIFFALNDYFAGSERSKYARDNFKTAKEFLFSDSEWTTVVFSTAGIEQKALLERLKSGELRKTFRLLKKLQGA